MFARPVPRRHLRLWLRGHVVVGNVCPHPRPCAPPDDPRWRTGGVAGVLSGVAVFAGGCGFAFAAHAAFLAAVADVVAAREVHHPVPARLVSRAGYTAWGDVGIEGGNGVDGIFLTRVRGYFDVAGAIS